MQIIPHSKQNWRELLLFPFKAYVAVAYITLQIMFASLPHRARVEDATVGVWLGYALCFWLLLIMAAYYGLKKRRRAALSSFGFAVVAAIFWFLLLPYLAA